MMCEECGENPAVTYNASGWKICLLCLCKHLGWR